MALNLIQPGRQHYMEAWNSPLSEAAVLGFEYGFSLGCRVSPADWLRVYPTMSLNAAKPSPRMLESGVDTCRISATCTDVRFVLLGLCSCQGSTANHGTGRPEEVGRAQETQCRRMLGSLVSSYLFTLE